MLAYFSLFCFQLLAYIPEDMDITTADDSMGSDNDGHQDDQQLRKPDAVDVEWNMQQHAPLENSAGYPLIVENKIH